MLNTFRIMLHDTYNMIIFYNILLNTYNMIHFFFLVNGGFLTYIFYVKENMKNVKKLTGKKIKIFKTRKVHKVYFPEYCKNIRGK